MFSRIKKNIINKIKDYYLSFVSVFVFFIGWQFLVQREIISDTYISSPSKIIEAGTFIVEQGLFRDAIYESVRSLLLGLSMAIVLGVLLGIIFALSRVLRKIFSPYIEALAPLPPIVIVPLLMISVGINYTSKIVLIFIVALFPIIYNTIAGVQSTDSSYIKMAKSYSANKLFIIRSIILPHSLKYITSGVKASIGKAMIAVIVAEYFGMGKGIGYYISFYSMTYQPASLMFMILVTIVVNLMLLSLANTIDKKLSIKY